MQLSAIPFCTNLSSSLCLFDHARYAGSTSVTVFLTNTVATLKLLKNCFEVVSKSLEDKVAYSLFESRPMSFNVIDEQFLDPRDQSRGGRETKYDVLDKKRGHAVVPGVKCKYFIAPNIARRASHLSKEQSSARRICRSIMSCSGLSMSAQAQTSLFGKRLRKDDAQHTSFHLLVQAFLKMLAWSKARRKCKLQFRPRQYK